MRIWPNRSHLVWVGRKTYMPNAEPVDPTAEPTIDLTDLIEVFPSRSEDPSTWPPEALDRLLSDLGIDTTYRADVMRVDEPLMKVDAMAVRMGKELIPNDGVRDVLVVSVNYMCPVHDMLETETFQFRATEEFANLFISMGHAIRNVLGV